MLLERKASLQSEQFGFELFFGNVCADNLIFDFAVFEEEQKGNRAYAVLHREVFGLIDIDFGDFGLAFEFFRKFVEHGPNRFAGAAPFCPEIDENGHSGFKNFGLEICFSNL